MENKNIKYVNVDGLLESEISYQNIPTPIDTIISRMDSGSYLIPEYQRNYIWESKQVVALIVSLLKSIPIPRLYMYSNPDDGKYTVIDGQQRLTSLYFFVKGLFPISKKIRYYYDFKDINNILLNHNESVNQQKREFEKQLKDKYGLKFFTFTYQVSDVDKNGVKEHVLDFKMFDTKNRLEFNNKTLDFGVISAKGKSQNQSTYTDIFRLLNSGGSPLTNQEIRNGLFYKSDLYREIHSFDSNMPNWQKIKKRDNNRDKNVEFLLRLLALDYYIDFSWNESCDEYLMNVNSFEKFELPDVSSFFKLKHYTGKYSDLIDKFSAETYKSQDLKFAGNYVDKLTNFIDGITNTPVEIKAKDYSIMWLNFEAFYVASAKLNLLDNNFSISYDVIKSFPFINKSTANTKEVVRRIIMVMKYLRENYER